MMTALLVTTPLPVTIQFMRYCTDCNREQIFVVGWECDRGLIGCCLGCGGERIAPFTRANSEAA